MINYKIHSNLLGLDDLNLESSLSSLTSQDKEIIDYLVNRFDDFPFAFGLIAPRGTKTFKNNRKDFLKAIVLEGLKPGKIFWKNWLKIAALLVKPGRKFFTLQDLNDTEHFRVFYHKADAKWGHRLESFISQELQTSPQLQN